MVLDDQIFWPDRIGKKVILRKPEQFLLHLLAHVYLCQFCMLSLFHVTIVLNYLPLIEFPHRLGKEIRLRFGLLTHSR